MFDKSVFNKKILVFSSCLFFSALYTQFGMHCFYLSSYIPLKYLMSFTQSLLRLDCRSWPLLRRCSKSLMVLRRTSISLFFSSWRCCNFCKNATMGFILNHHMELCINTICYYLGEILKDQYFSLAKVQRWLPQNPLFVTRLVRSLQQH